MTAAHVGHAARGVDGDLHVGTERGVGDDLVHDDAVLVAEVGEIELVAECESGGEPLVGEEDVRHSTAPVLDRLVKA